MVKVLGKVDSAEIPQLPPLCHTLLLGIEHRALCVASCGKNEWASHHENQPFFSFPSPLCSTAFLSHLKVCEEKRSDMYRIQGFGDLEMVRNSHRVGVGCYCL